jgi:hypothetical protein
MMAVTHHQEHKTETVFTMEGSSIKFGVGATREVGFDLKEMGVTRPGGRDPHLRVSETLATELASLTAERHRSAVLDQGACGTYRPLIQEAITFASSATSTATGIGGGSTIDN